MIKLSKKTKISFGCLGMVFLACGIIGFISITNTSAIATFTDNVLRPVLGADRVVRLEHFVFNFTDKVNQVKYSVQKPTAPQFNNLQPLMYGPPVPKVHVLSLDPIVSLQYFSRLPNEGVWQQVDLPLFPGKLVAASTFIRPDPDRSYAIVDVLKLDMTKLHINMVAGTQFPGGPIGNKGSGVVPQSIQDANTLVAAFSGGFQYADGHYGMIVGNKVYVPLKKDTATFVVHANNKVEIVNYTGQDLGNDVIALRQNCPILVDNGVITAFTNLGEETWGWTDNQANTYTIRTGIGITKDGDLLFAVGRSLVPKTLGIALKEAGAVNAMQLDINPSWPRFVLFTPLGNGKYTYKSYDKALVNGGYAYLHGWNKDFMYLYK